MHKLFLVTCVLVSVAACGTGGEQGTSTTSTTTTTTTATTTAAPDATFTASANDLLTALNMQLPFLHEGAQTLPTTIQPGGVFGGRVSPDIEIYVLPQSSLLTKVRVVTVHVTGSGGAFATPARLLSGVGASLHGLSADAADAFRTEALPKLSSLSKTRTTMTVSKFYDLTVVARDSSSLAFVFTPVGATPPTSYEMLGK